MIIAYFDGSCEPTNPGGTIGYGSIAFRDREKIFQHSSVGEFVPKIAGETSNNIAEYLGLISVLDFLRTIPPENSLIYGDSNLVVQQMNRVWRIKSGLYVEFALDALRMMSEIDPRPQLMWIPRDENTIADNLSRGIFT